MYLRSKYEILEEECQGLKIKSKRKSLIILLLSIFLFGSWCITFLNSYDIYKYKQDVYNQFKEIYLKETNKSKTCEAQLGTYKTLLGK